MYDHILYNYVSDITQQLFNGEERRKEGRKVGRKERPEDKPGK